MVPGKLTIENRGVGVVHRGGCGMLGCDQSMKTQNSTTNPKLGNKKSWSECRASWCVCGIFGCDQSMKTQNSTTNTKLGNKAKTGRKNRGVSVKHRGVCVCVECSDVINLWKPKTRQQIFLDSFSVLQFDTYVGSWRERQIFFVCVVESIEKMKKSFKFPSILLTENNFWRKFFRGPFFRVPLISLVYWLEIRTYESLK